MAQATAEFPTSTVTERTVARSGVAAILSVVIFSAMLSLIVLAVIPFGTSHSWWKAFFVCAVFAVTILWLIEGYLSDSWFEDSWPLVLPLALLALFAFLQTVPVRTQLTSIANVSFPGRVPVSADPYQTRFFTLELISLTLAGVLLFRHAATERRMRLTINIVLAIGLATAFFGILRQTTSLTEVFGVSLLPTGIGYGQYVNRNHFAFLMEMGLGLTIGLLLGSGVKREQVLIYAAALAPFWTALVLSDSRGGLVAMLAQLAVAALLFGIVSPKGRWQQRHSKFAKALNSSAARVVLIFVLIAGVVLGTIWLGGDRLAIRVDQARQEVTSEDPMRHGVSRQEIWKASWNLFTAHPVFGVGMGAYWTAVPSVHNASGSMTPREAHNDYLELLASGGLVGLVLGIWFVFRVGKRIRENLQSPHRFRRAVCYGAVIGITGVAVHSIFDFGLHPLGNALIFATLIMLATSKPRWANHPAVAYEQV